MIFYFIARKVNCRLLSRLEDVYLLVLVLLKILKTSLAKERIVRDRLPLCVLFTHCRHGVTSVGNTSILKYCLQQLLQNIFLFLLFLRDHIRMLIRINALFSLTGRVNMLLFKAF